MHARKECWILTSKNSAKLKHFHGEFLEVRYPKNGPKCPVHVWFYQLPHLLSQSPLSQCSLGQSSYAVRRHSVSTAYKPLRNDRTIPSTISCQALLTFRLSYKATLSGGYIFDMSATITSCSTSRGGWTRSCAKKVIVLSATKHYTKPKRRSKASATVLGEKVY